jgi:hypothetical protein
MNGPVRNTIALKNGMRAIYWFAMTTPSRFSVYF